MIILFSLNKFKFSVPLTLLLIFLNSGALAYYVQAVQPSASSNFNFIHDPYVFLFSFIPILFIGLFLYFLTNSGYICLALLNVVFIAFGFVNHYKSVLRQDPLIPSDFQLVSEFLAISKTLNAKLLTLSIMAILGILLILIVAFKLTHFKKMPLVPRLLCLLATTIVIVIANTAIYSNEKLYKSIEMQGNPYFLVDVYHSRGAIYSFLYEWNTNKSEKPSNYDKAIVANNIAGYKEKIEDNSHIKPNVIVIMGEAFSEISERDFFDFSAYDDPIENFKRLKSEGLSGDIIVPHVGGGTADTEFDVLTGANTINFSGISYSYRMLNKNTESIVWEYKKEGYSTVAIHPGYPWFYNRQNAYELLGFDEFIHIEDYAPEDFVAGYVSEVATYKTIYEKLAENANNHLFLFCVTIQNHGAYNYKYGDNAKLNFDTTLNLSDIDTNILFNYFYGLKQMDDELKNLTDYLNEQAEPYIVVYFGDHLPTLSNDIYRQMNNQINEENEFLAQRKNYLTPYLIWQNESYKAINGDISNMKVGYKNTIQASGLGVTLLNITGYGRSSPFFIFLSEYINEYAAATDEYIMDNNGNVQEKSTVPIQELYDNWAYYQINDSEY